MCTPAQCQPEAGSFLDRLGKLSTAEQFFAALELEFEPSVVNVSRLHILKRFHDLLDITAIRGLDDRAQQIACRAALARAYGEFASGGGAKTFKVFQQGKMGFVPMTAIGPAR